MTYRIVKPTTKAQIAAYHQLRFTLLRQPWGQEKGSEIDDLEASSVHRMIVDEQDKVVAVGRYHKTDCYTAQIRFMAVDDSVQGQGVGKLMLTALEQIAAQQGVEVIELNARENAVKFYQACDYQLGDKSHLLYGQIQHYKMRKMLQPSTTEYSDALTQLKQVWHQTISVSKHMLIHPASLIEGVFTVCADRQANINLHNTMFAGSIYTLATLTGWGRVHLLLEQQNLNGDIVLADADIRYHKPLHGQPLAQTVDLDGDVSVLQRGKRARLKIHVNVLDGDTIAASFSGKYVVLPKA
ncbi:GNAT family N-acetyltransferase [Thalassotalea sp. HSM 43]|uniref:bifunctional GNAT family N-acetyltransferase/hotdog fold thioesterase n=1 Tax=Thalassotalea sp. HSM 43 TaxID=2552945 RepID=UPI0010820D68|nr:bifunctional GNAT family N-acetyltransferase/hotdog fold thioesterase [Thalassotalea sp. HSM 43]QBY03880.1 GNAT family N-acetyltransferase [Thalassotalea sp. HSM 43]